MGKVMAERLDHERPLWCVDVVGPDDVGRTALVIRIHHCLADGVTALRMLSQLLWDDEGGGDPGSPRPWTPAPAPARTRMIASGVASRLRGAGGALAAGARSVASPRRWRQAGREVAALPGTLRRELWPLGADTAFDRRIGGDREVAFTACALEDLKRIEHSFGTGVTVNDVAFSLGCALLVIWASSPTATSCSSRSSKTSPPRSTSSTSSTASAATARSSRRTPRRFPSSRWQWRPGRPDRVCGIHFFNPAPMMALVEVVRAITTSDDTVAAAASVRRGVRQDPVRRAATRPGFIVNALLFPYLNNAVKLLDAGVATATTSTPR